MRTTLYHQIIFLKKTLCMNSNPFLFFFPSHENLPHKNTPKASDQVSEQASMSKDTKYKSTPICESKQAEWTPIDQSLLQNAS